MKCYESSESLRLILHLPTIQSTNQTLFSAQGTRNEAYSLRIVAIHSFNNLSWNLLLDLSRSWYVVPLFVLIQVATMCGSMDFVMRRQQASSDSFYDTRVLSCGSTQQDRIQHTTED